MNDKAKYIEVDKEKNDRIQHMRSIFSTIYDEVEKNCKSSRETSLAITKLEEAQFWAIKSITREKEEKKKETLEEQIKKLDMMPKKPGLFGK